MDSSSSPKNDRNRGKPGSRWRLPVGVARTLFVLFGLLPTLGTATWATWARMAREPSRYEAWLGARLGLEVALFTLEHPRPGAERIGRAELLDPETGTLLARAENIQVTRDAETIELACESLFLPRQHLMELWQLLHDRATSRTTSATTPGSNHR